MRICVTGDRGYIGSVVVPMLQRGGHHVVGFDAGWFDGSDFVPSNARYTQRTGDVRDVEPRDLKNLDAVIHLAGLPRELTGWGHGVDMDAIGAGARTVAAAAKTAGVPRFVQLSTVGSSWARPRDPVGLRPKGSLPADHMERGIEKQILRLATPAFTTIVLRNAAPFGSSPRLRLDTLLNALIAAALTHDGVEFIADGALEMPFVHVKDVARALITAVRAPSDVGRGGRYDVVNRDEWSRIRDAARQISAITGTPITLTSPASGPHASELSGSSWASPSTELEPDEPWRGHEAPHGVRMRSTSLPHFRPRWRIADGIREVCRALTACTADTGQFAGPKYDRMRTLAALVTAGGVDLSTFRLERAALSPLRFG